MICMIDKKKKTQNKNNNKILGVKNTVLQAAANRYGSKHEMKTSTF